MSRCRTTARRGTSARSPSGSGSSCRLLPPVGNRLEELNRSVATIVLSRSLRRRSRNRIAGVHNFVSPAGFSLSGVQIASRAWASGAIGFTSERAGRARAAAVLTERLLVPCAPDVLDHVPRVVPGGRGLLANQIFDLVVGDHDAHLLRDRLERELPRDGLRRLGADLSREQLGDWPVASKYASGRRPCSRATARTRSGAPALATRRGGRRPGRWRHAARPPRCSEGAVDPPRRRPGPVPRYRLAGRRACRTRWPTGPGRRRPPGAPSR